MRLARIVVPGSPYHITHRGNRGQTVFFEARDRERYQRWMLEHSQRWEMEIWAYCWMRNHVHLVATPHRHDSLSRVMGRTHSRYAQWINKSRGWTGHLWENRFYSSLLDENHFCSAVRYVELNPVRAGIVELAEEYRWSSARAHCYQLEDPLVASGLESLAARQGWSAWLAQGLTNVQLAELRRNTATGRPSAGDEFVRSLESRLGRAIARPVQRRSPA